MTNPGLLLRRPSVSLRAAGYTWQRNAITFSRAWRSYLLPNFLEPLLYLLAIGLGIGVYVGRQIGDVPYPAYIAPGLAASSAMYGAVFHLTYNTFVKLEYQRAYDAVITTPSEPEDVALGELLWAVTRAGLYGGAFVTIVVLLGYADSWWTPLAYLGLPLVGLSMGLVALLFTVIVTDIERFTYFFNLFIIPLFLFSGIFFPITTLPDAAQRLAWLTPLHHGVEMTRSLVLTGAPGRALAHAAWLVVFSALLLPPTLNLMRRRLIT